MKYSEFIKELEHQKNLSGEDNPNIVVADSYKSYEFSIKKIGQFYGDIGIFININ
jgi:hypothetical protein